MGVSAPRVLVLGTGTDVGKTHVGCALAACLVARGARVLAFKPVTSGGLDDPDAYRRTGAVVAPPAFSFARPLSPHLAARAEGRAVDLEAVRRALEEAERAVPAPRVTIVEGAGGVFSPLAVGAVNADLARACGPARVLLVAPDRLGVLHDVRATLLAAAAIGLAIDAVVLSAPAQADAATGTNAAELEAVGFARVAAVFPRAPLGAAATMAAADAAVAALGVAVSPT
jgi:dethiobiotin synthetase